MCHFLSKGLLITNAVFVTLFLSTFPGWSQSIFESVRVTPKFTPDPMTIRGVSGGPIPATNVAQMEDTETGSCVGFVDKEPDHTLTLTSFFDFLSLQIDSSQDTTLVIKGPGGTWCVDDARNNKNPSVAGQWLEGNYEVWVGSYTQDEYHPYVISISQQRK